MLRQKANRCSSCSNSGQCQRRATV